MGCQVETIEEMRMILMKLWIRVFVTSIDGNGGEFLERPFKYLRFIELAKQLTVLGSQRSNLVDHFAV